MSKGLFVLILLVAALAGCMADPASRGLASCGIELGLPPCGSSY